MYYHRKDSGESKAGYEGLGRESGRYPAGSSSQDECYVHNSTECDSRNSGKQRFLRGRWASLSVEARCRNAIDYSKAVNPIAEQLILERIDADLFYKTVSLPAVVSKDSGELLYTTSDTYSAVKSKLRPWIKSQAVAEEQTVEDMAAEWLKTYGNQLNG